MASSTFSTATFVPNTILSTRNTHLHENLARHQHWAMHEQRDTPFFTEQIIDDTMGGLYVDSRYPALTFVTPESWIFHALAHTAVCAFAVICTNNLRAYPSEFIRELVLLEARRLAVSSCMQRDDLSAELMARLDDSFRQAKLFRDSPYILSGYSSDIYHLDRTKVIAFFDHFRDTLVTITPFDLLCEDEDGVCALATHQQGFYFNSLPDITKSPSVERVLEHLETKVAREEYHRFSSLLSAPIIEHSISRQTTLISFISTLCKRVPVLCKGLKDDITYHLPVIRTQEYAKVVLHALYNRSYPPKTEEPPMKEAPASSSPSDSEPEPDSVVPEPEPPVAASSSSVKSKKKKKTGEKKEKEKEEVEKDEEEAPKEDAGGCTIQ